MLHIEESMFLVPNISSWMKKKESERVCVCVSICVIKREREREREKDTHKTEGIRHFNTNLEE